MTDGYRAYRGLGSEYAHQTVDHHSGEYVRGSVHTQVVESYFSLFKRGLTGAYHHVSEAHLNRYMSEFDFRWSHRHTTDGQRTVAALGQTEGKRLRYRRPPVEYVEYD